MRSYESALEKLIKNALEEDIGEGDHSTLSAIQPEAEGKAVLKIKQDGILAGMQVAEKIFRCIEPGIVFNAMKKDGDTMRYGEIAFEVDAKVYTILQCERLVLNCMQRMSGIASLTNRYAFYPAADRLTERSQSPAREKYEGEGRRPHQTANVQNPQRLQVWTNQPDAKSGEKHAS